MKRFFLFIVLGLIAFAGWWIWENHSEVNSFISDNVGSNDILTLEARYSPDQIMNAHRKDLLGDDQRTFQEPTLKFYPYLLLNVKYSLGDKSKEGVLLWSMENGEMVLNTSTWETTHGYDDCISSGACSSDFKVMHAITKKNDKAKKEDLIKELGVDNNTINSWLEEAEKKHLIINRGGFYSLYFENPKLQVMPQTKITQPLVTKPYQSAMKVPKKFSKNQIENIAQAAFGSTLAIRETKEIFLPVYNIEVLNPDGSIMTSHWNALTGERISPKYLTQ